MLHRTIFYSDLFMWLFLFILFKVVVYFIIIVWCMWMYCHVNVLVRRPISLHIQCFIVTTTWTHGNKAILSYLILSYLILSYLILSYLILSYLILSKLSGEFLQSYSVGCTYHWQSTTFGVRPDMVTVIEMIFEERRRFHYNNELIRKIHP